MKLNQYNVVGVSQRLSLVDSTSKEEEEEKKNA